jgi:GTP-binding protein LepA
VINKIDLPSADPDKVRDEVEHTIGLDCSHAISCSAKTGQGVVEILESIVHNLPPPRDANASQPLRALIFDSYYDVFRGVVVFFRVMEGSVKKGDIIRFINSNTEYEVLEVGFMTPSQVKADSIQAGEVGFLSANIKAIDDARVGDTFTLSKYAGRVEPLPGYEPAKQMVFAGLYPSDSDQYEALRDALGKLKLNDASLSFSPETSSAMGFGFRCGFLGLLHMDIIQERLEREYDLDLIVTAPSVVYKVVLNGPDQRELLIDTPSKLPDPGSFEDILEPFVRLEMISPSEFTGPLMDLATNRRGVFVEIKYLTPNRTALVYEVRPILNLMFCFSNKCRYVVVLIDPSR